VTFSDGSATEFSASMPPDPAGQPPLNLAEVLAQVRHQAVALSQAAYSELGAIVDAALPDPLDPLALLPIATGLACGATIGALIPVSAAVMLMAVALRIVDDCADQDNPHALHPLIGSGRAMNAAFALSAVIACTLSQVQPPGDRLVDDYFSACLQICQGQDQDIRHLAQTLPEYEQIVLRKTVAAYEFAAHAGAAIGTDNPEAIAACRRCGTHLGWMIQILDDIEALWFPDGPSDLACGRFTFPILHGLAIDHPQVPQLRQHCSNPHPAPAPICTLLDQMEVRLRLMTQALDHRDSALSALSALPQSAGLDVLRVWLSWLLRDGDRLIASAGSIAL
jgi:geranylgeranyl diphosphate synthase, type I